MATTVTTRMEENTTVNQSELLNLFLDRQPSATLSDASVLELVHLLGGINNVMTVMLQSPDHIMSKEDRKKLQQHLTAESENQSAISKTNIVATMQEMETTQISDDVKWTLITNDNILFDLSPWIAQHLYSKWVIGVFLVHLSLWLTIYFDWYLSALYLFLTISTWIIEIPWTIAALLSVNRAMIPRIAMTVDTWIKTACGLLVGIYCCMYEIHAHPETSPVLQVAAFVTVSISFMLFLLVISSLDGIQEWNHISKLCLATFASGFCVFWFFVFEFIKSDYEIEMMGGSILDVRGRAANAYEVLFIFLGKQAILTWMKGSKKCIVAHIYPYIEWKEPVESEKESKSDDGMDNGKTDH